MVYCRIFIALLQNHSFFAIYAVLSQNLFCRDLRAFCVEKNCIQKCAMWRKMTNMMYALNGRYLEIIHLEDR